MATTATARSNRKGGQNTTSKESPSASSQAKGRAGLRSGDNAITIAIAMLGGGSLGIAIGGGWGAVAGVVAGALSGWFIINNR